MFKKVLLISLGICLVAPASLVKAPLDGKTYTGTIMTKGEAKDSKDTVTFKAGKFTSTECIQYGFKASKYEAKTEGDTTTFTAEAINDNKAKMNWKGTVKGNELTAQATWTHEGEDSKEMNFKGTLKAKE